MKVEHPHPAAQQRTSTQPFKRLLAEAKRETPKAASTGASPKPPAIPALKAQPPGVKPNTAAASQQRSPIAPPAGPHTALAAQLAHTQAVSAQVAGAQRQVARTSVNAEAERLTSVRASHHEAATQQTVRAVETTTAQAEKVDARVLSLIVKELESAFEGEPPHVERAVNCDGKPQALRPDAPPSVKPAEPPARAEQAVALIERIETFVRSSRPALALTLNNSLGARVEIERLGPGQVALKLIGQKGPPSADAVSRIREELRARGLKVGALSVA